MKYQVKCERINWYNKILQFYNEERPRGVMVKAMNYGRAITLTFGHEPEWYEPPYPPSYRLNTILPGE